MRMTRQPLFLIAAFTSVFFSNTQAATIADECKRLFDEALWQQALSPCIQAAKAGDRPSQSILGELYDRQGNSVRTHYWWSQAANAGYLPARNQLAMKYYYGGSVFGKEKGWKQDYAKAYEIWKQDALQGVASAQFIVGEMHFRGQGVEQDLSEAWAWFNLALDRGYKMADDSLVEISKVITQKQRQLGKTKLAEYQRQIGKGEL